MARRNLYNPGNFIESSLNDVAMNVARILNKPEHPLIKGETDITKLDIRLAPYFPVGAVFTTHADCREYKIIENLTATFPQRWGRTTRIHNFRIMRMDNRPMESRDALNLKTGTLVFRKGMAY